MISKKAPCLGQHVFVACYESHWGSIQKYRAKKAFNVGTRKVTFEVRQLKKSGDESVADCRCACMGVEMLVVDCVFSIGGA